MRYVFGVRYVRVAPCNDAVPVPFYLFVAVRLLEWLRAAWQKVARGFASAGSGSKL